MLENNTSSKRDLPSFSSLSLEGINLYALRLGNDNLINYANSALCKLVELSRDAILGMKLTDINHKEYTDVFGHLNQLIEDSKSFLK